jgi:hypothetical protein
VPAHVAPRAVVAAQGLAAYQALAEVDPARALDNARLADVLRVADRLHLVRVFTPLAHRDPSLLRTALVPLRMRESYHRERSRAA